MRLTVNNGIDLNKWQRWCTQERGEDPQVIGIADRVSFFVCRAVKEKGGLSD